ncbi:cell surface protein [Haloferax sp. MBLA0077]|uniref:Cell surface protein n=2 Tax=Haloferax TaxID=2251 RepID=A0A6G1Z0S6_9EURY|nr:cell surface protein [Haloferax sp. CBA1149]MRW80189.1 cell surface protein [Haloferax marinisediminis]
MVAALLFAAVAPLSLGAAEDYDIDIDGSIDTVDRSVSTSYGEFTVTEVGRANTGDSVTVSVTALADESYSITILDSQQRIRRSRTASGDTTATFDTAGMEAGTYAVAVGNQSTDDVYEVEPLVIRAYDVVLNSNNTVEEDSSLDVTIELDQVEPGEPTEAVQVALTSDTKHVTVDATKRNDSAYTATVPVNEFAPGDYSMYAVVRSDDTALGEKELVGVSDEATVEVVERSTDESDESSSGGGSSSGSTGSDTTETPTTTTQTATPTDTQTPTETTQTETTEPTETTTKTQTTTASTQTTATTDNVVTPNEQTTQEPTTSSELPNTAPQVVFGLLVVFAVTRRLASN